MSVKAVGSSLDDLSNWRLFLQICEQKSIGEVSQSLNTSASTVSRRIKAMEEKLGYELFYRTPRVLEITPEGRRLKDAIEVILNDYDTLLGNNPYSYTSSVEDFITISASPCFNQFIIGNWVLDFQKNFPNVMVKTVMVEEAVNPVSSGIDIAIHSGPIIRTIDDSPVYVLGALTSTVAASSKYLEEHGWPKTPEDLAKHVLLHYSGKMSAHKFRMIDPEGNLKTLNLQANLESTSTTGLIRPAIKGKGILLYACHFMLHEQFDSGELVEVFPNWTQPLTFVTAVPNPRSLKRVAVKNLIDYIKSHWCDVPGLVPSPINNPRGASL